MTEFTIQPCKLRDGYVVPQKNTERWQGKFSEMLATFFFGADQQSISTLYHADNFSYIGIIASKQNPKTHTSFVVRSPDLTNNIKWLIRTDKNFPSRLISIFKVIEVKKTGETIEKAK